MEYRDIVIHVNTGIFGNDAALKEFPPIQERVELSDQIWLGRLDREIAKLVMDTCEAKAFGIVPPARQFAELYSFVRDLPPNSDIYRWDEGSQLTSTVAISRLLHPTSTGLAYAARVAYGAEGLKWVYPAQVHGISVDVFLSRNRTRDWLTEREARVLSELVPRFPFALPPRIHRALWHHEYAARTYYLDYRWTLVCTGLEALVHTDKNGSTRQFTRRVSQLASEFGLSLPETDAREAYDLRSQLAHGVSFLSTDTSNAPSPFQIQLYDRLEDTLRKAVLRAMRCETFANIFRTDDEIRRRWPI